jgi:hypothetical protein
MDDGDVEDLGGDVGSLISNGARVCFSLAYCLSVSLVRVPCFANRACMSRRKVRCQSFSRALARAVSRAAWILLVSSRENAIAT